MRHVVGLVPAAGSASRLGRLPCSKEIFPVAPGDAARPRVACDYLLEGFRTAGIRRALILLRKGKWDVPALLGDGAELGLSLAYLALAPTAGVPETLDAAYPFVEDCRVALGFPDIRFEPRDAFVHLLRRQQETGAAVVLGLFPTRRCDKADMVELGADGRIRRIVIKQADSGLEYCWSIAVWGPDFSRFLHRRVAAERHAPRPDGELYIGDVVRAAIDDGLPVVGVPFPHGSVHDFGTPEDLAAVFADADLKEC